MCFFFVILFLRHYTRFWSEGVLGSSASWVVSASKLDLGCNLKWSFFETFLTWKIAWENLRKIGKEPENLLNNFFRLNWFNIFVVVLCGIIINLKLSRYTYRCRTKRDLLFKSFCLFLRYFKYLNFLIFFFFRKMSLNFFCLRY